MERLFPHIPKSTATLVAGDFWAVPLGDGTYSAGRVLQFLPKGELGTRSLFLGGLINWHGSVPPQSEDLAARRILDRGIMHLKAITEVGGAVLGNRPLELDQIEAELAVSGGVLMLGLGRLGRTAGRDHLELPVLGTWGFRFIQGLAEKHFRGSSHDSAA